MSSVRPILEYRSACWDPCRRQINALDKGKKKADQLTNHTKNSYWETLAQPRTIGRLCALIKAYTGENSWNAVRDRLRRTHYLNRADRIRKIRFRKQRTDIGKWYFVNRTIKTGTKFQLKG
jgi:hypothetical protein